MTKHTPGPLYVSKTGMLDDYPDGPLVLAVHAAGDNPRDVYETALIVCNGDLSEDEAWANGKLYASAPDLLAACKFVVNDCPEPGEDAQLTVDGYNRLCAAIAKAEGQAVQP